MRLTADELMDDLWLLEKAVPCWTDVRRELPPAVDAAAAQEHLLVLLRGSVKRAGVDLESEQWKQCRHQEFVTAVVRAIRPGPN